MHVSTDSSDNALEAPDNLLEFPRGLPGFEAHRRFRLLHEAGNDTPAVYWLQSVDDPEVQLSVTDPATLQVNYEITLSDDESALLGLDTPADCAVLVVLYREDRNHTIRASFLAPLLINTDQRIGLQKVLNRVAGTVTIRAT